MPSAIAGSSPRKVAVIGAGRVGVASLYSMLIQGIADAYTLIDIDKPKAHAEVLDLNHGLSFVRHGTVEEGEIEAAAKSDVVIITAGAKQKPGQSRMDLAETNARIVRDLVPRIVELAPESVILVVTNPVDVMTMVAHEAAREASFPTERVIGSGTVLDSSRFRFLLARRLDVHPSNVHAVIVGEHGDSEVPLWSSATVAQTPLHLYQPRDKRPINVRDRVEIFHAVRNAAQEIIAGKGATDSAIGLATARIVQAILRDERSVLTVSSWHEGYGALELPGACFSVPTVVGRAGVIRVVHEAPLNDAEALGLAESVRVIREAFDRRPRP